MKLKSSLLPWQIKCWRARNCTIEKCTDGTFIALDHEIQSSIAISENGETIHDCWRWLKEQE